jgi:hypothetical protein
MHMVGRGTIIVIGDWHKFDLKFFYFLHMCEYAYYNIDIQYINLILNFLFFTKVCESSHYNVDM